MRSSINSSDSNMLVLMPNERILMQRDASIVIKHKYVRAKEEGKGTFYITTYRLVFEDHKKGIILQVYPSQNELQAYRVNKSLLGGERLLLDVQRVIEGKILNVLAEVSMPNASEAVKAIEAMRSDSVIVASNKHTASTNIVTDLEEEEEEPYDAFLETKTKYDTVEVPLYEGEEIKGFWHDVDIYSVGYDHNGNIDLVWDSEEEGRGSKVIVTTRNAYYVTPYGWRDISSLKEENESSAEYKGNIAYVHNYIIRGKPRYTTRLTFKSEEEAKEFVKLWWEQKRARQKGDNEKLVNFIQINMVEREDPKIIPVPQRKS
ncbi:MULTISPECIES: hypothetical protein [Candidatus Nitrosocaldus]|nr:MULTISPECIES: hypothetical protein [Candidatus Nitrosocaldus]